jgi:Fe-S cluster assembly iron-binding protein IscA
MLEVTEKANEMIKKFFEDKDEPSPIRIFLSQGG